MLPANTVWLEPNTTKAPMNNVNFRKAMAYAINPQQLVSSRVQRHHRARRARPGCCPT